MMANVWTHKTRDQTGLADTLLAQEDELELLEWVVGRREIARSRGVGTRHCAC